MRTDQRSVQCSVWGPRGCSIRDPWSRIATSVSDCWHRRRRLDDRPGGRRVGAGLRLDGRRDRQHRLTRSRWNVVTSGCVDHNHLVAAAPGGV